MSVTGGLKQPVAAPATPWPRWARANVLQWFALIGRPARGAGAATLAWRAPLRLAIGAVILTALVGGTMIAFDVWAIRQAQRVPQWLIPAVEEYTEFGKSSWVLVPTGVALLAFAALASPALPRMSRIVLAALSVRIGFVFLALAVPGMVIAVVKRLIGRARPLVGGSDDPFTYLPFGWDVEYASLPSGHASTAFGVAGRGRSAVAAAASAAVDLRDPHRGEPRRADRPPPERCARRRCFRGGRRAPGPRLVRGAAAGLRPGSGRAYSGFAGAVVGPHQKGCPAACRPIRSTRRSNEAGGS